MLMVRLQSHILLSHVTFSWVVINSVTVMYFIQYSFNWCLWCTYCATLFIEPFLYAGTIQSSRSLSWSSMVPYLSQLSWVPTRKLLSHPPSVVVVRLCVFNGFLGLLLWATFLIDKIRKPQERHQQFPASSAVSLLWDSGNPVSHPGAGTPGMHHPRWEAQTPHTGSSGCIFKY